MDQSEIIWTTNASIDLRYILDFYIERNKSAVYSKWLLREIEKRIILISRFPKIGRITNQKQVRLLPFHHYGIIYRVTGSEIYIQSIWDFRRNPNNRIDLQE